MSYLALGQRDHEDVSAILPAVGLVGTALFLPMMLWHLFAAQRGVFYTVAVVAVIAVIAVTVELAYFKTDAFGYSLGEETTTKSDWPERAKSTRFRALFGIHPRRIRLRSLAR